MATGDESHEEASRLPPYIKRPPGARIPPDAKFTYPVHAKNRSVVTQWDAICSSHAGNARRCYDHLALTPYARPPNPARGRPLRRTRRLPVDNLFQYEVGGGARIWYQVDEVRHIVVIQEAHSTHPKATE